MDFPQLKQGMMHSLFNSFFLIQGFTCGRVEGRQQSVPHVKRHVEELALVPAQLVRMPLSDQLGQHVGGHQATE